MGRRKAVDTDAKEHEIVEPGVIMYGHCVGCLRTAREVKLGRIVADGEVVGLPICQECYDNSCAKSRP